MRTKDFNAILVKDGRLRRVACLRLSGKRRVACIWSEHAVVANGNSMANRPNSHTITKRTEMNSHGEEDMNNLIYPFDDRLGMYYNTYC